MELKISDEKRLELEGNIKNFFLDEFDQDLGILKTETVLNFFIRQLAPVIYNRAVNDAHAFMVNKLEDLEGDLYFPPPEE